MSWSPSDVSDQTGKIIAITGATSGIGLHAAKILAHHGAKVVMLCRNVEKMAAVATAITTEKPCDIVQLHCDVSDLESVRACVEAFKDTGIPRIDVLILNAGILSGEFKTSSQGVELTFATNHLGHWLLTGLLLDYMKDVRDSRIVSSSSMGHQMSKEIDYEIVRGQATERYKMLSVYSDTKLANHWMTASLNRRLAAVGAKTIAVATHPGISLTELGAPVATAFMRFMRVLSKFFLQSAEQGSWPLVMAATDPNITTDCYYGPKNWFETSGPPMSNATRSQAVGDQAKADELWVISEELCCYKYSI